MFNGNIYYVLYLHILHSYFVGQNWEGDWISLKPVKIYLFPCHNTDQPNGTAHLGGGVCSNPQNMQTFSTEMKQQSTVDSCST